MSFLPNLINNRPLDKKLNRGDNFIPPSLRKPKKPIRNRVKVSHEKSSKYTDYYPNLHNFLIKLHHWKKVYILPFHLNFPRYFCIHFHFNILKWRHYIDVKITLLLLFQLACRNEVSNQSTALYEIIAYSVSITIQRAYTGEYKKFSNVISQLELVIFFISCFALLLG